MDSSLAESMNAQVLTMSTSASSADAVISMPCARTLPSMISASTRFFAQPREIMPTFFMGTKGRQHSLEAGVWKRVISTGLSSSKITQQTP